jgi:hypothetical protein
MVPIENSTPAKDEIERASDPETPRLGDRRGLPFETRPFIHSILKLQKKSQTVWPRRNDYFLRENI